MKIFLPILCLLLARSPGPAAEPIRAAHGMVVSSHWLASEAGVQILRAGGNAVDAAIGTGLALAVVHPSAGNIGGGGFMVLFAQSGEVTTFDFREKAPLAAHEKMYLEGGSNHEGHLSVGVPGTVAGFDLALKRFGKKSWRELGGPQPRPRAGHRPVASRLEKTSRQRQSLPQPGRLALGPGPNLETARPGGVLAAHPSRRTRRLLPR
jgi:gamma-glutamyltranspeptidase